MTRTVYVALFIGPTGCGKTHMATTIYPDAYVKGADQWWEHYSGERQVVFDDFSGAASKISVVHLLRMLDKFRMYVETKGASEWFKAETIVLTTNIHPWNWYNFQDRMEQFLALARRFSEVRIWPQCARLTCGDTAPVVLSETTDIQEFFEDPERWNYEKHPPGSKN